MSKDTIYREDAIKAINLKARIPHDIASAQYAQMAINAICSVPSADRPRGEWVDKGGYAICSNCGAHSEVQYDGVPVPFKTRYCHDCGAHMKGADDE